MASDIHVCNITADASELLECMAEVEALIPNCSTELITELDNMSIEELSCIEEENDTECNLHVKFKPSPKLRLIYTALTAK